ncbi:hypothetical protein [Flavobacterium covae]|uniref:hypothetical protein n=1 Tax=Flavobacterium covae TaxID=2906076 RepID=UPI000AF769A9|nr:hypothetical protein [Flavobacterium covae]MCJ1808959.1 hypothetical protein [Flavobacterium covae]
MNATKTWLETKITELNHWLQAAPNKHPEYAQKEQNRNYYVRKLIELEEYELEYIEV